MTEPTVIADLAGTLLAVVTDAFAADGVALPDRSYITFGPPVAECSALVVSWDNLGVGAPGTTEAPGVANALLIRRAQFTVWVFRCLSGTMAGQGQELELAPAVEDLTADATAVLTDAFVTHRGINRARAAGTFGGVCSRLVMGEALPYGPEGGIGGCAVTITAEVS